MATRRMIPTSFFRDPDILMLNKDEQLILIGLVLAADDYGRELAHAHLLGTQMGYTSKQMEAALQTLVANDLLVLYEGGRHRYYSLTRWWKWQTIPEKRRVPSNHPAPPTQQQSLSEEDAEEQQAVSNEDASTVHHADNEHAECMQRTHATSAQENLRESKRNEEKKGEEKILPPNVVTFPTLHTTTTNSSLSQDERNSMTHLIATILKLPVNDALERIVEDYCDDSLLSLRGESDAAREWIDDTRRNRNGQRMSPSFFRRWLKREHEDALKRRATRITDPSGRGRNGGRTQGTPADDPYAAFLAQRTREVAGEGTQGELGGSSV